MDIGLFGGTFNPPHNGHLVVAEYLREALTLNKIVFIPASISPHKRQEPVVAARHRLTMVRRAIKGNPFFESSDIELRRGGVSYTIDTLREMLRRYPGDSLHLLIGMDNVRDFHTWKDPEEILALARVIVMTRPGFGHPIGKSKLLRQMRVCEVPEIDIASRDIRARVRGGKSIRYLVPAPVEQFINAHGLYR